MRHDGGKPDHFFFIWRDMTASDLVPPGRGARRHAGVDSITQNIGFRLSGLLEVDINMPIVRLGSVSPFHNGPHRDRNWGSFGSTGGESRHSCSFVRYQG